MELLPDDLLRRFFRENGIVLSAVKRNGRGQYVVPEDEKDRAALPEEIADALNRLYFSSADCVSYIESLFEKTTENGTGNGSVFFTPSAVCRDWCCLSACRAGL